MEKNDWRKKEFPILSIFGVLLLFIGLVASFYRESTGVWKEFVYPYQSIGIMLTLAGIGITVLGFILATLRRSQT